MLWANGGKGSILAAINKDCFWPNPKAGLYCSSPRRAHTHTHTRTHTHTHIHTCSYIHTLTLTQTYIQTQISDNKNVLGGGVNRFGCTDFGPEYLCGQASVPCKIMIVNLFRVRTSKNMIVNVYGRPCRGLPSFAASCEGRTFDDEKGWRAARCDGVKLPNLIFSILT